MYVYDIQGDCNQIYERHERGEMNDKVAVFEA